MFVVGQVMAGMGIWGSWGISPASVLPHVHWLLALFVSRVNDNSSWPNNACLHP